MSLLPHATERRPAGFARGAGATVAVIGIAVFAVAYDDGSYSLASRSAIAIAIWWTILVGVALGAWPSRRIPRAAFVTGALLAAFAAWDLISTAWAPSAERAFNEFDRTALYLGAFVIVVVASRDDRLGRWLDGLALAIVATAIVALVSRLFPGSFPIPGPADAAPELERPAELPARLLERPRDLRRARFSAAVCLAGRRRPPAPPHRGRGVSAPRLRRLSELVARWCGCGYRRCGGLSHRRASPLGGIVGPGRCRDGNAGGGRGAQVTPRTRRRPIRLGSCPERRAPCGPPAARCLSARRGVRRGGRRAWLEAAETLTNATPPLRRGDRRAVRRGCEQRGLLAAQLRAAALDAVAHAAGECGQRPPAERKRQRPLAVLDGGDRRVSSCPDPGRRRRLVRGLVGRARIVPVLHSGRTFDRLSDARRARDRRDPAPRYRARVGIGSRPRAGARDRRSATHERRGAPGSVHRLPDRCGGRLDVGTDGGYPRRCLPAWPVDGAGDLHPAPSEATRAPEVRGGSCRPRLRRPRRRGDCVASRRRGEHEPGRRSRRPARRGARACPGGSQARTLGGDALSPARPHRSERR